MFKNKNPKDVATSAGLEPKPLNLQTQRLKTAVEYKVNKPLTQEQKKKRHLIFSFFVSLMRAERLERENESFVRLISETPELSRSKVFGTYDLYEIYKLGLVHAPTYVQNILVCRELEKQFGDLSIAGCFYRFEGLWRLDISKHHSTTGLLLPVRDRSGKLIEHLLAFRHINDEKPFKLRLRVGGFNV